jgi:hypothetical protein
LLQKPLKIKVASIMAKPITHHFISDNNSSGFPSLNENPEAANGIFKLTHFIFWTTRLPLLLALEVISSIIGVTLNFFILKHIGNFLTPEILARIILPKLYPTALLTFTMNRPGYALYLFLKCKLWSLSSHWLSFLLKAVNRWSITRT